MRLSSAFLIAAIAATAPMTVFATPAPIDHSMIVQVAGGCGAGWHRGPNGGCRRNYKAENKKTPCPRGYYLNIRTGRCKANGR